jgi:predicted transcriptional regulator
LYKIILIYFDLYIDIIWPNGYNEVNRFRQGTSRKVVIALGKTKKKVNFEELCEVKGEMKKLSITLEDMAKALGRSVSGLCKILNGDVDITRSTMKRITAYMNRNASGKSYTINELFN